MTQIRLRQAVLLARPVARSLRPVSAIAGPALAAAVATLPQDPVFGARLGAVTLCLGAAFLFDDPAASTIAAVPPSLIARRLHRLAIWVPVLAAAWAVVLWSTTPPDVATRSLELTALLSATLAASAGLGGVAAGPVVLALLAADELVVARFPSLADRAPEDWRAGLLLAVGLAGIAWLSIDPARSGRPLGHRRVGRSR